MKRWMMLVCGLAMVIGTMAEGSVEARLRGWKGAVPLPYDEVLEESVGTLNGRLNKGDFAKWEGLLEEMLVEEGLPRELRMLPLAISNMDATWMKGDRCGVWGLETTVAIRGGLIVTKEHDERFCVGASTAVAVRRLKELYGMYGNWWAVILAYVNGPAALNGASMMANGNAQVWDYYKNGLLEEVDVVKDFIGCCVIMNGEARKEVKAEEELVGVTLQGKVCMEVLKKDVGVDMKEVKRNNGVYRGDVLVPLEGYDLYLKKGEAEKFLAAEDSIYARSGRWLHQRNEVKKKQSEAKKTEVVYVVKRGDSLGKIAQAKGVSVSEIKALNRLKSDMIYEGQRLVIRKGEGAQVKPSTTVTTTTTAKPTTTTAATAQGNSSKIVYTVKRGDTLSGIAQKYRVRVNDIKRWNNLKSDAIREKQKLVIYKK